MEEIILMKIGIPNALLYFYYGPFWEKFFEELNIDVIVSDETSKELIDEGIKESVPEICVPIKIFVGHALNLLKKEVDFIFVPRMVSIYEGEYFCPKFTGLPDLLIHGVKDMEDKILTCHINSKDDDISNYTNYLSLAEKLEVSEEQIINASKVAGEYWRQFRMYNKMGYTIPDSIDILKSNKEVKKFERNEETIKIGVLGYVYNIYDNFVNMGVIDKLHDLNVEFVTFDMLEENEIMKEIEDMEKRMFWTFSNILLGAGYNLISDDSVDGTINITAFGCGPDSFLTRLFELKSNKYEKPFMVVRIDEHTGENHLLTRIEAFVDMIKRKKSKVLN